MTNLATNDDLWVKKNVIITLYTVMKQAVIQILSLYHAYDILLKNVATDILQDILTKGVTGSKTNPFYRGITLGKKVKGMLM